MSPGRSQGIGARLLRKEDDRFLMGRGQYVGDFKLPGMQEVAFLRSPLAHASIKGVRVPAKLRDRVFSAEDLGAVAPIRADTALPGFKSSVQPVLAQGKVRYVGELVAMCVAGSRAEAEDMAAEIELELEPMPAVTDMLAARKADSPLVHEAWGDNLFLSTLTEVDFEAVLEKATHSVTARTEDVAAGHEPARGARRARPLEFPPGSARGDELHPTAAYCALRPGGVPRHRRRPDPRGCSRCRRRLWL